MDLASIKNCFDGKNGLEIGGPSPIFSALLPVYDLAHTLDGCNYSTATVWGAHADPVYRYAPNKSGRFFVREASCLDGIGDASYDFVIASHCLEHCANAIKTLHEWLRVLKDGGALLLILPNKENTFDHRRATTTFEHLQQDLAADITEGDLTHLDEILLNHDLSLDLAAGTFDQFKARSLLNFENRCLHQHVFDLTLLSRVYAYLGLSDIVTATFPPHDLVIFGKK